MKDPAALLYVDKWISATQGMKVSARGWYMDLILYQFDKGPIPNDEDFMAGICRVLPSEYDLFKQVLKQVLKQKFKQNESGEWENGFAAEVITARESFKEKRSNSGNIGWIVKLARSMKATETQISGLKKGLFNNDLEYSIEELKNKQVLKQVLKLYINEDEVVNKITNTDIITPKALAAEYHKRCPGLKAIKEFPEARKLLVKSRLADFGLEKILTVFDKAQQSDFLKGGSKRGWVAGFDWVMTKNNFIKILEDTYKNPEEQAAAPNSLSFSIQAQNQKS